MPPPPSRPIPPVREHLIELLGTGASSREELLEALEDRSTDEGRPTRPGTGLAQRLDELIQRDPSFAEVGDGIAFVPSLVEGTSWTVPVDPDDARDGYLRLDPHLGPLAWWLIEEDVELVDDDGQVLGTHEVMDLELDDGTADVLFGPSGWVSSLGDLARVDVVDGRLRWTPTTTAPAPSPRQLDAIDRAFDRAVTRDIGHGDEAPEDPAVLQHTSGEQVVLEALATDRSVFVDDPLPPLSDLFEAAGLEVHQGSVARSGFDWEALERWRLGKRYASYLGLEGDDRQAFLVLLGVSRLIMAGDEHELDGGEVTRTDTAQLTAAILDRPACARALWEFHVGDERPIADLDRFANWLQREIGEERVDGLDWLRARCLDVTGDTDAAVALLDEAVGRGSDHELVRIEAAAHASDTGDAATARRHLRVAGFPDTIPDDERDDREERSDISRLLVGEVGEFASRRVRPAARRNDPCPCGSGRKYKVCHQGKETLPLDDRAPWLFMKAERFVRARAWPRLDGVAGAIVSRAGDPGLYDDLRSHPLVFDLVLHEGGSFEEFLDARRSRLPADEVELAERWAAADRSVFEVIRAGGTSVHLRDLRSGDEVRVGNVHPDVELSPGMIVMGRPVPVDDGSRTFAGLAPWTEERVPEMLEAIDTGDALQIAALMGRRNEPMRNPAGEELAPRRLRWRLPDGLEVGGVTAALAEVGVELRSDPGDGTPRWVLPDRGSPHGPDATAATFLKVDDELVAEVNSAERAELCEALVGEALPDAELIEVEELSLAEALASFDLS